MDDSEIHLLRRRLDEVRQVLRRKRRAQAGLLVKGVALGVALAVGWVTFGDGVGSWVWLPLGVMLVGFVGVELMGRHWRWTDRDLALRVEGVSAGLEARLVTVLGRVESGEALGYFERRLLAETLELSRGEDWGEQLAGVGVKRWTLAGRLGWVMVGVAQLWLVMGAGWWVDGEREGGEEGVVEAGAAGRGALSFEVRPGNVEVERGSRVVVEATVDPLPMEGVELVWGEEAGGEVGRVPMRMNVDGKGYGGLLERVEGDGWYRVEVGDETSDAFVVTVFEHPQVVQVDVRIEAPAFMQQAVREVKKTMKVSAPMGSVLDFRVRVNKPVAEAELFADEGRMVKLTADAGESLVLTGRWKLEESVKMRVHLVDAASRANKNPPWLTLTAVGNRPPKVEVVFPKKDLQVSPLQELPLEAVVSDDVSVLRSGLVLTLAGQTEEMLLLEGPTAPKQKEAVGLVLPLESRGVEPKQLISYYFWAEDQGSEGEVRRSMSDLFFAQVRAYEDIFRETEPSPPSPGEPGEQTPKLLELQKQVVSASWRLLRDVQAGQELTARKGDAEVVLESERMALEQTKEAMEEAGDGEMKAALTEAWVAMRGAIEALEQVVEEGRKAALAQAMEHEQAALQALYRASAQEHLVARQQQSQSSGGMPREKEEQLMDLELKQEEERYEAEKQAAAEASPQQAENLKVLSRLKELARRQEALAKKMQEIREQMAMAETKEEAEALEQQLKQLEEEQEALLADVDELQGEMDEAEGDTEMAEAQEELREARERVQDAAEKLEAEDLTAAVNAASRASEELGAMEESFRQRTSSEFERQTEALKREVAKVKEAQDQIGEALENQRSPDTTDGEVAGELERMLDGGAAAREIAEQRERVESLLQSMRQLSEDAEVGEPLLSRKLYEAVRGAQAGGLQERLEEAQMQSQYGQRPQAQAAEREAAKAVGELAEAVDAAAEAVLGSEAEALRMARAELDHLIARAEEEVQGGEEGKGQATAQGGDAEGRSEGGEEEKEGAQGKGQSKGKGQATAQGDDAEGRGEGGEDEKEGAQGKGQSKGKGQATAQGGDAESRGEGGEVSNGGESKGQGDGQRASQAGGPAGGGWFFDDAEAEVPSAAPISGAGYREWTDRLRVVEEVLKNPELANQASQVLDEARAVRVELQRNPEPPRQDHLQVRIVDPLVELRDRVMEELARLKGDDPTVPMDRDPVPPAYRELVKEYYRQLGQGP